MRYLFPSQKQLAQSTKAILLLFICQLVIVGCQSSPTPIPTDIPPPTNTPDPYLGWLEFHDPWSRYSLRFPPEWYLFPAPFAGSGYATIISTLDVGAVGEPSREYDVPQDELVTWFSISSLDPAQDMGLMEWVEARFHPGGVVLERREETISGVIAVVELIELHSGQQAKIVHFSTASGILSIFGQPWGNSHSETFDHLIRTVSFQQ